MDEHTEDRGLLDLSQYVDEDLRSVLGRIARELHLRSYELDKSSDEEVEIDFGGIQVRFKPSDLSLEMYTWEIRSFLLRLFVEASLDKYDDEAKRSLPSPYNQY